MPLGGHVLKEPWDTRELVFTKPRPLRTIALTAVTGRLYITAGSMRISTRMTNPGHRGRTAASEMPTAILARR
jgi:hypothetical protein